MPLAHKSVMLSDRSSVGEARRAATQVAQSLGFDQARRSDLGIAVTEAATNSVLHGKEGEFLICPFGEGDEAWIDLVVVDSGKGISDVARAMEDGYSTIGTAGHGLSAIERLADASSLYSAPGKGAVSWCRFFLDKTVLRPSAFGVVSIPVKGEHVCGDGYFALPGKRRSVYAVVDGLGHGPGAAEAAEEALLVLKSAAGETASEIITTSHEALRKTRGAAMSVAIVDHEKRMLTSAGVGNVQIMLSVGGAVKNLVSQNGTLGAVLLRVQEYDYPVAPNTLLMMSSDGLSSRVSLAGHPGLQGRPPAVIAGLLYRDFTRRRDDATILVARLEVPKE